MSLQILRYTVPTPINTGSPIVGLEVLKVFLEPTNVILFVSIYDWRNTLANQQKKIQHQTECNLYIIKNLALYLISLVGDCDHAVKLIPNTRCSTALVITTADLWTLNYNT